MMLVIIMIIAHIHCGLPICRYVSLGSPRRICSDVVRCVGIYWVKPMNYKEREQK